MASVIEKTAKTAEDALKLALEELGVGKDQVDYEITEETEKKGLFGIFGSTKQVTVKVTVRPADPVEVAKEFLAKIFKTMSLDVMIEKFASSEGTVTLHLHGASLGILIGKHGQTLDALQYLTNLAANKNQEDWVKIVLDIENYRKKRTDTLTKLALRLADKAKRRHERVALEPMNSHERKIIHMALQEDKRITTYSEGEEPYRHIVIMAKK